MLKKKKKKTCFYFYFPVLAFCSPQHRPVPQLRNRWSGMSCNYLRRKQQNQQEVYTCDRERMTNFKELAHMIMETGLPKI